MGVPLAVLIPGSTAAHLSHAEGWLLKNLADEFRDHKMIRWGNKLYYKYGAVSAHAWYVK